MFSLDNSYLIKHNISQALVSTLEKKIDSLDRKHDETSLNISDQLKESSSSDYDILSNLAAENERLKVNL